MGRAGLSNWYGGMICLPNRKRALAVSSIRDLVRKRIGAPLTIMTSPWRSSNTRFDMRPFLVRVRIVKRHGASPPQPSLGRAANGLVSAVPAPHTMRVLRGNLAFGSPDDGTGAAPVPRGLLE